MEHLQASTRLIADEADEKRIQYIQNTKWIGYPAAKRILDKLDDLLEHPTILRMPNMLLVGDTNNGKTVLVNRFFEKHRPVIAPEDTQLIARVVYVQAPTQPIESQLYNAILNKLHAPYKVVDRLERKQHQVVHLLKHVRTKILIIDEIHNILAGSTQKQHNFRNVLKFLANELQLVIVGVGTGDALHAINGDEQLANRFDRCILHRWKLDQDYQRLLASFERLLPLKQSSNLFEEELAVKVFSMSEGTIGETSRVLTMAAIAAIRSGKERIDKKVLTSIEYNSPSERRKMRIN